MRKSVKFLAIAMVLVFALVGCGKQPTADIEAAKAAVDAFASEGGDKYATDDMKTLNDALTAAMDEVKTQDAKMFKNYDKAKEMLVKVKADAETVKGTLAAKKEQAKNDAMAANAAAMASIADAQKLLAKAPKGKGSAADIAAMKAEVEALKASLGDVQPLIDKEEYIVAKEKADAAKAKADEIAAAVKEAMAKKGK